MAKRILITGGADFVRCHLTCALLERGDEVRLLDSMIEQVHSVDGDCNPILRDLELIEGDVRDLGAVTQALEGIDTVIHHNRH